MSGVPGPPARSEPQASEEVSGTILGLLALALVVQASFVWMRLIRDVRVGERRPLVLAAVAAGVVLGGLAFWREPGLIGGIAAGVSVASGSLFLLLVLLGRQSRSTPAVRVGAPSLDFSALDGDGKPFRLASLAGRPYLLKFFRGHW